MSTRAAILIKDGLETINIYRHSDGYPSCTGADLTDFVKLYETGVIRNNASQSAGWLIIRGHAEYCENKTKLCNMPDGTNLDLGWKVGAYEPTTSMHGDEEYIYIIDLIKNTLTCRVPKRGFWDNPSIQNTVICKTFKTIKINLGGEK